MLTPLHKRATWTWLRCFQFDVRPSGSSGSSGISGNTIERGRSVTRGARPYLQRYFRHSEFRATQSNQPIKVSIRSHTHTPDTTARRGRRRSFPTKFETRCDETAEHKSQTSQRAKERVSKFARIRLAEVFWEEPISILLPACTVSLATRFACLMAANCPLHFNTVKYHKQYLSVALSKQPNNADDSWNSIWRRSSFGNVFWLATNGS